MFEEESESEDEADGVQGVSSGDLLDVVRGFGHMQANDSGWPALMGGTSATHGSRKSGRLTGRLTILR